MKNRMFVGGLFIVTWLLALGSPARASLTVTNGPQLWLDAGVGVQTSGTGVTNWLDQSGKGNHASQGVAGSRPTHLTSGFGSGDLPSVRFDGVNDSLDAGSALGFVGNTGLTISVVLRFTGNASEQGIIGNYGGSGAGYILYETFSQRFQIIGPHPFAEGGNSTAAIGNPMLVTGMKDASSLRVFTNGTQLGTSANASPINSSPNNLLIGHQLVVTSFLDGDIAEVLIYDRSLDLAEHQSVNEYFFAKYGIPEPSTAVLLGLGWVLLRKRGKIRNPKSEIRNKSE